MFQIHIAKLWSGRLLPAAHHSSIEFEIDSNQLKIKTTAPFFNDPPPKGAAGRLEKLWEHEVVELFLLGEDARYIEIELGPHGHYLALELSGWRNVVSDRLPLTFKSVVGNGSWQGEARLESQWLPKGFFAAAAFAMHGLGDERQYAAAQPAPAKLPDFHQRSCFIPLAELSVL